MPLTQASLAVLFVVSKMFSVRSEHHKILWAVVIFFSVDVMYDFTFSKFTSKRFFHGDEGNISVNALT